MSNHLTLIFKVLYFATKNKYPRNRNAYEYWDDRQNSRIDLAKAEYGGPFTAEQVQGVKAFFRIFSVLLAGTFLTGIFLSMFPTYKIVLDNLMGSRVEKKEECFHIFYENCFLQTSITRAGDIALVFGLPVVEFLLLPIFRRCLRLTILHKVTLHWPSLSRA